MIDIESSFSELPVITCSSGEYLLNQEEKTDSVFFLRSGSVMVMKDGYEVTTVREKGAVFGDMSILLDIAHSASVQCLEDSSFYHIDDPGDYLKAHPEILWHIAQILSMRLFNLNQYLVDLKTQYEGHDHLSMVDKVLETLMNQQKTKALKREDSKRDVPDY